MKTKVGTLKEQRLNAELDAIIQEMGHAMWNANKAYIANAESPLTLHMNDVLCAFQDYCVRYYAKKA